MTGPPSLIRAAVIKRQLCDQHRGSCVSFAWNGCASLCIVMQIK
jgi:hypothetical protein